MGTIGCYYLFLFVKIQIIMFIKKIFNITCMLSGACKADARQVYLFTETLITTIITIEAAVLKFILHIYVL